MNLTRCERLQNRIGQKEHCKGCNQMKVFGINWLMDKKRDIFCPECNAKPHGVRVSIV